MFSFSTIGEERELREVQRLTQGHTVGWLGFKPRAFCFQDLHLFPLSYAQAHQFSILEQWFPEENLLRIQNSLGESELAIQRWVWETGFFLEVSGGIGSPNLRRCPI